MTSSSESGHSQNVANFEDIITFCGTYGPEFNPSKPALQLPALTQKLNASRTVLQRVRVAATNYENATNAREIAYKPVKALVTKISNALAACGAAEQTLDNFKTTNFKIQGRRAKKVEQPSAEEIAKGAVAVKTNSVSQQSFDKTVDHFEKLLATLAAEPLYAPNEIDLQLTSLNARLTNLTALNTAVISAKAELSNARIARDLELYSKGTGLHDTAQAVKQYIKSVFGANSPQYQQISIMKFRTR